MRDQIEDQMAEIGERQDFFRSVAEEDNDELLDELNQMETEAAENDLDI